LYKNYLVTCIGIKKDEAIVPVSQDYIIQPKDRLIVAGNNDDLKRLTRL
jgi:Trk K+ transport system NAD-binding subunit